MKELSRAIEAFRSKRAEINAHANAALARNTFVLQGERPNPEMIFFSFSGGLEMPFSRLINVGVGVWTFLFDQMLEETAAYIADLTGGRKVKRDSLRDELQYYREVAREGLAILQGKPEIVWGLN